MSGPSSPSSEDDPPPKEWNLPPELEREALFKCEEGTFIVCRTCNEYDPETTKREKKGSISVRKPFWYYAFKEHVQSKYHSANVRRKEFFENEALNKSHKKRKAQSLLPAGFFGGSRSKTPSAAQVRLRIEAGVTASLATVNDTPSNAIDTLSNASKAPSAKSYLNNAPNNASKAPAKFYLNKFPQDNLCRGILATQDLEEVYIQKGLFFMSEYYMKQQDVDIRKIEGTDIYSFFAGSCSNKNVWCVSLAFLQYFCFAVLSTVTNIALSNIVLAASKRSQVIEEEDVMTATL
jgi:hypothetical protein